MRLRGIPLAWLQLKHEKLRFVAAIAGITFAVVLVFEPGLAPGLDPDAVMVMDDMTM